MIDRSHSDQFVDIHFVYTYFLGLIFYIYPLERKKPLV